DSISHGSGRMSRSSRAKGYVVPGTEIGQQAAQGAGRGGGEVAALNSKRGTADEGTIEIVRGGASPNKMLWQQRLRFWCSRGSSPRRAVVATLVPSAKSTWAPRLWESWSAVLVLFVLVISAVVACAPPIQWWIVGTVRGDYTLAEGESV